MDKFQWPHRHYPAEVKAKKSESAATLQHSVEVFIVTVKLEYRRQEC